MKRFLAYMLVIVCGYSPLFSSIHIANEQMNLPDDPRELYIDLMKRCVAGTIYEDPAIGSKEYNERLRINGKDYPSMAHTMIGMKRLNNIHYCMKEILSNHIPGDFIETGVWRGGATILMKAILKAYGCEDRNVWVADSFEGVPPPNPEKYPDDAGIHLNQLSELAISLEKVQAHFKRYGLLDNKVIFLKGFFSNTLPTAPINQIALLRLDGDLYESTMDGLVNLYPKVAIGGYVIVDDFGAIPACAKAVRDYRQKHNITDPIIRIDWTGVFWQKTK